MKIGSVVSYVYKWGRNRMIIDMYENWDVFGNNFFSENANILTLLAKVSCCG